MRTRFVFIVLLLAAAPARAQDVSVLMLKPEERAALVSSLGAALMAQPGLSPQITYLLGKINTAGVLTQPTPPASPPPPLADKKAPEPDKQPGDPPKEQN